MKFTELTGSKPDDNCLHCYLAPVIDKWLGEHRKNTTHAMFELRQVVGELIGSAVYNSGGQLPPPLVIAKCTEVIAENAARLLKTLHQHGGHG